MEQLVSNHHQNHSAGSEAGDTLIEVLIAVVILGITCTALLAALLTTITSASEQRSSALLDSTLKSYAEQLKYDVELQGSTSWYTNCAPVTSTTYNGNTIVAPANQPPAGYTVTIQSIEYWNGTGFDQTQVACTANNDSGLQVVTLFVQAPNHFTQTLQVGLRAP